MPQKSGKIIANANFFSLKFDSNIYDVMFAMVGLAFLFNYLKGS